MTTYTINTECGLMADFSASSVEQAKEIYADKHNYDFDGAAAGEYPGSWYWIAQDGVRVEDESAAMPG